MGKISGNEPAFPDLTYEKSTGKPNGHNQGLTIRAHFSAMAMQGLVSNNFSPTGFQNGDENGLAIISVKCADALIQALNQSTDK